jgi:hypothetical protein
MSCQTKIYMSYLNRAAKLSFFTYYQRTGGLTRLRDVF